MRMQRRAGVQWLALVFAFSALILSSGWHAQAATQARAVYGPFHGTFLADGEGIEESLPTSDAVLAGAAAWTLHAWVRGEHSREFVPLFGFGDVRNGQGRLVALIDARPMICLLRTCESPRRRYASKRKTACASPSRIQAA